MTTDFFWKKVYGWFCGTFAFVFTVCVCVYAVYLTDTTVVETQRNFYYLVSSSTHIEASAHDAQYLGGAGYTFAINGRDYVAYAAYTGLSDGEQAYESLIKTQEDAMLLTLHSGNVYLKTPQAKEKAGVYKSAFDCLYAHIRLLNNEISRLEDGATQQSVKRFLETQRRQFAYMTQEYQKEFPAFSLVCRQTEEELATLLVEYVYLKDMRYLLCSMCNSYMALSEKFRL